MKWIEYFGKPESHYRGHGSLTNQPGQDAIPVSFEVVQVFDGRVFCECTSTHDITGLPDECDLTGHTEYGYDVTAYRLLILGYHDSFRSNTHGVRAMVLDKVHIRTADQCLHDHSLETCFTLTNFRFPSFRNALQWTEGERKIIARPLPDHEENIKIIRATQNSGVTTSLMIPEVKGVTQIPQVVELANKVCWLFSLAQGRGVHWVCCESMSEGQLVERCHQPSLLLPPTGPQLIPLREHKDIDDYVAQCLVSYDEKEQTWKVSELIDVYVRAVASSSFAESKGLMLAVLMDIMQGIYLKAVGKEHLIDNEISQEKLLTLKEGVGKCLEGLFPDDSARAEIGRYVQISQRPFFSDTVAAMCESLGLRVPEDEVRRFVRQRNELTHCYRFFGNDAPDKICDEMMSLVSKIILAMLGYNGYYYDWAIPSSGDWENRRVKMQYAE